MTTERLHFNWPLLGLEWVARCASVASITLLVTIFIGEAFNPSQIAAQEWFGLVFFPLGVVIGMVIAWWKEALGGTVTVVSLFAFYLVYGYLLRNHIGGWAFIIFSAPGFLFLLHALLRRIFPGMVTHES